MPATGRGVFVPRSGLFFGNLQFNPRELFDGREPFADRHVLSWHAGP